MPKKKIIPKYKHLPKSTIPLNNVESMINYYSNWLQSRRNILKLNMEKVYQRTVSENEVNQEIIDLLLRMLGTTYLYGNPMGSKDASGSYNGIGAILVNGRIKTKPGTVIVQKNYPNEDLILLHEGTHSATLGSDLNAPLLELLPEGLVDSRYRQTFPDLLDTFDYYDDPIEQYPFMMMFRKENNLDPKKKYTEDEIKSLLIKSLVPGIPLYDTKKFTKALNEIAYIPLSLPYAKHGAKLISKKKYIK